MGKGVAVILATTVVGVLAVALTDQGTSPTVLVAVATVLPAIAAINSIRRGRERGGREGLAWHVLAIAMAMMTPIYVFHHVGWSVAEYTFVTLAYICGATAAIIIPLPTVGIHQRIVASLDSLSIGIVVATAAFWLVSRSELETISVSGWIVANAAIMSVVAYIAMRRGQRGGDWPLVWLATGTAGYLGGALLTALSPIGYVIGGSADYSYVIGMMGFALAPTVRDTKQNRVLRPVRWTYVLIPYVFVAALAAILVGYIVFNWQDDPTGTIVVLGLLLTMAIAVIRQLAMIAAQRRKMEVEQRGVIATVSHELRTPLTSIVGFLDMLEAWDSFSDDEKIEMVSLMRGQSHVLARVVDDLVSLARSEIESTALTQRWMRVADLIGYAIGAVPELDQVNATFEIPSGLEVYADRDRMLQVIANFLSNAVNYGGNEVAIVARKDSRGSVIEVHDNGPGVPDIFHLVIWERFERGPQRQSSIPGSGIGLSVARGIAHAHGGATGYRRSERLGGACFSIAIPDGEEMPAVRSVAAV